MSGKVVAPVPRQGALALEAQGSAQEIEQAMVAGQSLILDFPWPQPDQLGKVPGAIILVVWVRRFEVCVARIGWIFRLLNGV